jgi:16S rRNA (cytosine1402-N4)-methyltransferase
MFTHIPVLPQEVLDNFNSLKKDSLIIDGTLGKGGHSKLLLEKGFQVIGIDRDLDAFNEACENLKEFNNFQGIKGNFSEIRGILDKLKIKKVNGILLDTGISTYQLENSSRGFGFDGNLDMRMDQEQELTAKKIINEYPEKQLAYILYKYGEKVNSKEIARKIVEYRKKKKIETGGELLKLIKYSMDERYRASRKHHWATPTFRALRIEVNQDYEHLEKFFSLIKNCVESGGIIEIITFHSIEEEIVKKRFKDLEKKGVIKILTKKPIEGSLKEIAKNPKTKRAKLWVGKRV